MDIRSKRKHWHSICVIIKQYFYLNILRYRTPVKTRNKCFLPYDMDTQRRRLETHALVDVTMTVMLNNASISFMGRAGIMVNKVRKTFKIDTVWIVTVWVHGRNGCPTFFALQDVRELMKIGKRLSVYLTYIEFNKGKAVPLQTWSGPEVSMKLRFPDYMTAAQDGGKVVSLTHRPPLHPGNAPGTHFC